MSVDDVVTVELPLRARPEPPEQQAIFTPNGDQIAASQLTEFISYVESETGLPEIMSTRRVECAL